MKEVTSAKNMQQLAVLWDLAADYDQEMTRYERNTMGCRSSVQFRNKAVKAARFR